MIIAIINNKGGTGKTTTTVNLGGALAELGYSVLVVDLDSQASASIALGAAWYTLSPSLANVLLDCTSIESVVRSTARPGLDLITADRRLIKADQLLSSLPDHDIRLRMALDEIEEDYDFILCDCPPGFNVLSLNAMVAAHAYLIPVTPDYLSLEDLGYAMGIVDSVRQHHGVKAHLLGILINMTPKRTLFFRARDRAFSDNLNILRAHYGPDVFTTEIPRDRPLAEAPAYGTTVFGTAPSSHGAKQYMALAEELIDHRKLLQLNFQARRAAKLRRRAQTLGTRPPTTTWGNRPKTIRKSPGGHTTIFTTLPKRTTLDQQLGPTSSGRAVERGRTP